MNLRMLLNKYRDFKLLDKIQDDNIFIRGVASIKDPEDLDDIIHDQENLLVMDMEFFQKNKSLLAGSLHHGWILGIIGGGVDTENIKDFNNPIFLIPNTYDIDGLSLSILKTISRHQHELIEENEMINKEFMKMNINKASIEEYIIFLSQIIGRDIIYYGKLDYLIHNSGQAFLDLGSLETLNERDLKDFYIERIEQNSQLYGYIIINDSPGNILEKNKLIIEYTGNMILIKIQNQIAIDNSKEIARSDLIADLCMDNVKTKEEVRFRAGLQGWHIDSGLLAIIFDIDEYKYSMVYSNKTFDELEEEKQMIFNLIINEIEEIDYSSYFYRKSDSIIFLINVDLVNNFSHMDEFIRANIEPIHNMINEKDFSFTLTIGIGTYYEDIMQTYKSYNEAIEAINISRIFKEIDDISCYKDIVIFKDLMEIVTKKDYNSIYINLIKNLREMDKENRTDYFKTLKCIIKNDWNLKTSSEELFIHYNTIIYRFEKLKDLLGMDLAGFYEKLIITLAVMILEVEKHIDFNKGMFKKQLNI